MTLVFDVPEHEELPTVDKDVWSKYFTKSEEDENTFIYNDKLEFTAGSVFALHASSHSIFSNLIIWLKVSIYLVH